MDEFTQYIPDVFRLFGRITLRRMFAGYGIFHDDVMFGLVYNETLYLKTDVENLIDFKKQNLKQFEYTRQGRRVGLSYYQAPDSILEDPNEAAEWAHRAFEAALRAGTSKSTSRRVERAPIIKR